MRGQSLQVPIPNISSSQNTTAWPWWCDCNREWIKFKRLNINMPQCLPEFVNIIRTSKSDAEERTILLMRKKKKTNCGTKPSKTFGHLYFLNNSIFLSFSGPSGKSCIQLGRTAFGSAWESSYVKERSIEQTNWYVAFTIVSDNSCMQLSRPLSHKM